MNTLREKLAQRPLLADGAMGTMLYARGASSEQCLEYLVLTRPQWVTEIHQAYAAAGADLLETHTFGANRTHLAEHGLEDKLREINFQAVKLARDVREVAGRDLLIAGSVGPLSKPLHPHGPISSGEAYQAFAEQVGVLWEAGADLIILETFSDIEELEIAVRATRDVCDLPLVASMTYEQDGRTPHGTTPEEATERLAAAGVDVVGVNCSTGPALTLQILEAMHRAAPNLPLSAMPNAGFPSRVHQRLYFPSSDEYFAQHVGPFIERGARIVGGCCGTTPAHIRAMREALDRFLSEEGGEREAVVVAGEREEEQLPEMWVGLAAEHAAEPAEQPTRLLRKLQAGRFVVSVEVDPPRGFVADKQLDGARHAMAVGADAVNVADSPMARVRMAALALCTMIQSQVGIETILHFTTRDRSLMGLQADLIGAHSLGVRNILALTGDPPSLGDTKGSSGVYDVDSVGLVRIISRFNEGYDLSGREMGRRASFAIGVACDPTCADLEREAQRLNEKISAGAHFVMTQPIYDPQIWANFVHLYEERFGPLSAPVLIGVLPLQSFRHAAFLHNEVPGITLTEEALERMRQAGANGREEGVRMAQELLLELKDMPYVQGVYLMPSFGRYEVACQVLEVLDLGPRTAADEG